MDNKYIRKITTRKESEAYEYEGVVTIRKLKYRNIAKSVKDQKNFACRVKHSDLNELKRDYRIPTQRFGVLRNILGRKDFIPKIFHIGRTQ